MKIAWIDATAGIAGDMLLGALIDAGAPIEAVQAALDATLDGAVELRIDEVMRGSGRAAHVRVIQTEDRPVERTWPAIRSLLQRADLAPETRVRALATFQRLAQAEAYVHGTDPETVHFHEVGALDAIGDIVGSCEALRLLGVERVAGSWVALGEGRIRAAHGLMPVPAPAVLELSRGWCVRALPGNHDPAGLGHHHDHGDGHPHDRRHPHDHPHHHGDGHEHAHDHHHGREEQPAATADPQHVGELATPTGMALLRALADDCEPFPAMVPTSVGLGAGGKDFPGWANCVRVVVGDDGSPSADELVEIRANVDDIDPRLLPGVIEACLAAGAVDSWSTPILMKKGRPGFLLQALAPAPARRAVADALLSRTTTLGVRESAVSRTILDREFATLELAGQPLVVKVGLRDGVVVHAQAEFSSLEEAAAAAGLSPLDAAQRAQAAIVAAGLVPGAAFAPPR